jgi:hypothetical protein
MISLPLDDANSDLDFTEAKDQTWLNENSAKEFTTLEQIEAPMSDYDAIFSQAMGDLGILDYEKLYLVDYDEPCKNSKGAPTDCTSPGCGAFLAEHLCINNVDYYWYNLTDKKVTLIYFNYKVETVELLNLSEASIRFFLQDEAVRVPSKNTNCTYTFSDGNFIITGYDLTREKPGTRVVGPLTKMSDNGGLWRSTDGTQCNTYNYSWSYSVSSAGMGFCPGANYNSTGASDSTGYNASLAAILGCNGVIVPSGPTAQYQYFVVDRYEVQPSFCSSISGPTKIDYYHWIDIYSQYTSWQNETYTECCDGATKPCV